MPTKSYEDWLNKTETNYYQARIRTFDLLIVSYIICYARIQWPPADFSDVTLIFLEPAELILYISYIF